MNAKQRLKVAQSWLQGFQIDWEKESIWQVPDKIGYMWRLLAYSDLMV